MKTSNIGSLIRTLRHEKELTQQELAAMLNISDKTISKWERGLGCPDISLITNLSEIFHINAQNLLDGQITKNDLNGGNMKNSKYFVCPTCQNLILATGNADISCCGRKILPLPPQKATETEKLTVENIDGAWFISSDHPMSKEHYISFVAFSTGDSINLVKRYPEWGLDVNMPSGKHGTLLWYCTLHGLFFQWV